MTSFGTVIYYLSDASLRSADVLNSVYAFTCYTYISKAPTLHSALCGYVKMIWFTVVSVVTFEVQYHFNVV